MLKFFRMSTLSFFTRLYLSILVAVFFSVALTQYFVIELMDRDAMSDFVRDTQHIHEELNRQIALKPISAPSDIIFAPPFSNYFDIRLSLIDSPDSICQQCEYLGEVRGVEIFGLIDEDRLLAVHPLPDLNMRLIVTDKERYDETDDDIITSGVVALNAEEAVFVLFVIILLFIISICIYWPIRQLQKQINGLVSSTKSFGSGELTARADEALTKPLNTLAHSFNGMARSIADTVKENQIFAQAVPHEVRTPLSRVQLAVGLLRKKHAQNQHLALLDNIDTYIEDIDELITQVVDFSKLNSLPGEDETNAYQTIMFDSFITDRLQKLKSENKVDVECDIDSNLEITTNPIYLRLLVDNLIKNAINHCNHSIKVAVKTVAGATELTVSDDGPGVPIAFQETIFFPFARLDKSRSRKTGGLGLGLAIAKAASKRMNSELSVDNLEQGGAVFICRFQ